MTQYTNIKGLVVPKGKMVLRKENGLSFWGIDNDESIVWTLISEELYNNILIHEKEYEFKMAKNINVIGAEIISPK